MNKPGSLMVLLPLFGLYAMAQHPAADQAKAQAKKLLAFYLGPDDTLMDNIEIDSKVTVLPHLKNPAGKGYYDVLEVWGYVYKAQYRMHFLYGRAGKDYFLVGQEILEWTQL